MEDYVKHISQLEFILDLLDKFVSKEQKIFRKYRKTFIRKNFENFHYVGEKNPELEKLETDNNYISNELIFSQIDKLPLILRNFLTLGDKKYSPGLKDRVKILLWFKLN